MKTDECLTAFNSDSCDAVPITPAKYGVYLGPANYANLTTVFSGTGLAPGTLVRSLKSESATSCTNSGETFPAVFYDVTDSPATTNEILTYPRLCGCTNLPSLIIPNIRSMQNPRKCVRLFSEKNCAGTETKIPAYHDPDTSKISTILVNDKKSISTCNPLPTCMTVTAEVFKVEIVGGAYEVKNVTINDIDALGSLATFENKGSGIVTAEYSHSHEFKDRATVTLPDNLGRLKLKESSDIEYTSNPEFPSFAKTKIVDAIIDKLRDTSGSSSARFVASETIQIPHCQKYKVNSYVTGVQNYPVTFTVSARLTGRLATSSGSNHILTPNQLQNVAKDLGLQPTINGSTAVVKVDSTIIANLGIAAVVIDESSDIQGCYDINATAVQV